MSSSDDPSVRIRVNGEDLAVRAGASLADLLRILSRDPRAVAVEWNGEIVRRDRWEDLRVAAGDRVEIVQFVQGGLDPGRPSVLSRLAMAVELG